MKTMSAFVSFSESFNKVVARFQADPLGESDAGKANHRWTILNKFEINFNHNTSVSPACGRCGGVLTFLLSSIFLVPLFFVLRFLLFFFGSCSYFRVLGIQLHLDAVT